MLQKETHPNDVMTWYFNDIFIAQITGDQSKICTDDRCKERFRDRLKLDHPTGSLTITNTTNTHSGEYKLQIISGNISIIKTFSSFVQSVSDSGPSSDTAAGMSAEVIVIVAVVVAAVVLIVAVVAGVICCRPRPRPHPGNVNRDHHNENQNVQQGLLSQHNGNPVVQNGTVQRTSADTCIDVNENTQL